MPAATRIALVLLALTTPAACAQAGYTSAESGVPGYMAEFWWGTAAPARTPPDIVNRLAGELTRALQSPEVKRRFAAEGAEPAVMSREQFTRFVTHEIARWREVARESNIKVD